MTAPPATAPPAAATLPHTWQWRLYGLIRPVVRPIAWRLRTFFVGDLQDDIRALHREIAILRAELQTRGEAYDAAIEPRIAAVMEQAVLTLALDREQRRIR